ncbi:MAG: hypothetical protein CL608_34345 [Anaerolineaceae bacterium]|jgi:hypothetical protein|nr:hypothetical protein [Anaerolineaceae bacterium]
MKTTKKKTTSRPKPKTKKPVKYSLQETVTLLRTHCQGMSYAEGKTKAASVGFAIYPRAWGTAFPKAPTLTKKAVKPQKLERSKPKAKTAGYTSVQIMGAHGLYVSFPLNKPTVEFDGDRICIREGQ